MSNSSVKHGCSDCGPNPTPHYLAWLTVVVDWLTTPYTRAMDAVWRWFKPLLARLPWDQIAFGSMYAAQALGLGKVVKELKDDHSLRTRALWEEAQRRGIEMFEFRPFGRTVELMVARHQGQLFAFDGLPRPRGQHGGSEWMDDKTVMRQKLAEASIPIARGGTAVLVKKALEIFDELEPPVIVKPRLGSRSRHTHMHIGSRSELVRAFYSAQKLCPWVVIEQELRGPVFRATVIAGRLIGVARRDLPHITGDGRQTVGELVTQANNHPARQGKGIFTKLPDVQESQDELARQELNWSSVPAKGQMVVLNSKVNRGLGGVTVEVTPEAHSDNITLFEKIARVVDDHIIGIDFIISSIKDPWHQQEACGVIECNSLPFIDLHHYPISGAPRNPAGAIWDLVWPEAEVRSPKEEPVTA
ncbi:MAG: hypothetical protein HY974_04115 [Candidatus Kerfeldbacteria bacterium]|nr:hypothetical protein [Candidatus Kerfeldbacteria bacterium]